MTDFLYEIINPTFIDNTPIIIIRYSMETNNDSE